MKSGFYRYWGKVNKECDFYHLLVYHLLDVAASGSAILKKNRNLSTDCSELLDISTSHFNSIISFILALHDLGKFSSAFQYIQMTISDQTLPRAPWQYDSAIARHDQLGTFVLNEIIDRSLKEKVLPIEERYKIKYHIRKLIYVSLGHHGAPIKSRNDFGNYFTNQNVDDAYAFVEEISLLMFGTKDWMCELEKINLEHWPQISWYTSGLCILADWIGSNSDVFSFETKPISLAKYWNNAKDKSDSFLNQLDIFRTLTGKPLTEFKEVYGFDPSPLQTWALEVPISEAGGDLFILEDLPGSGKTEAAFVLLQRMLTSRSVDGFYFALPTKATANSMYERISSSYGQFYKEGKTPSLVLAHGSRNLNCTFKNLLSTREVNESYSDNSKDQSISAFCDNWFADSKKKALLAPCGVGTVDQVMKVVLSQRFHTLPLIGLYRKVLVIDEIHSADAYMTELLCRLLTHHFRQGGSVILLSATLSQDQKQKFIDTRKKVLEDLGIAQSRHLDEFNFAFPLATRVNLLNGALIQNPISTRLETEKYFQFIESKDKILKNIIRWQSDGKATAWIRNSVQDVLDSYKMLIDHKVDPSNIIVFHSRFTLIDRINKEATVLNSFGKRSVLDNRNGKIILATQVLQESLDIDVDEMVTDICPIDDLIQRTGRHRRHPRNSSGELCNSELRGRSEIYIFSPPWTDDPTANWLYSDFYRTKAVYRSTGLLWLTARVIRTIQDQHGSIRFPRDSRVCIEMVYGLNSRQLLRDEAIITELNILSANDRRESNIAGYVCVDWSKGYSEAAGFYSDPDSECETIEISTRYSDYKTQTVFIARESEIANHLIPYAGIDSPVELSTISIPLNTYAKHMNLDCNIESTSKLKAFRKENRIPDFMKIWVCDRDPKFEYSSGFGLRIIEED